MIRQAQAGDEAERAVKPLESEIKPLRKIVEEQNAAIEKHWPAPSGLAYVPLHGEIDLILACSQNWIDLNSYRLVYRCTPKVFQGYCHPQMWNDRVTIGYEQSAYFYKHQITCIMSATFPFPLQRTLQYTQ